VTWSAEPQPFLDAGWLKPGAFAAIADLGVSWLPAELAAFDRIVIDDLTQEASQPNKLAAPELVSGDLSQLVLGKLAARDSAAERNAFLFRGHALGDIALAALAWERAQG